jgi:hypothetical protein
MDSFSIEVNTLQTMVLLDAVDKAVSPESFFAFLDGEAVDFLNERLINRFAVEGDSASGDWPALSEATQSIRESMGFPGFGPINERTGDMLQWIYENHEVGYSGLGAELVYPGPAGNTAIEEKIRTAQMGKATNPFPGAGPTPPRPVLAVDEYDLAGMMELLAVHIFTRVKLGM